MSIPPPKVNRIKFADDENKVLAKPLSEIVDSSVFNDAKSFLGDNSLIKAEGALEQLKGLNTPMGKINEALSSGAGARDAMGFIESAASQSPELRSVTSSISSLAAAGSDKIQGVTKSIMGSLNSAMEQNPATIGNFDKLSTAVKNNAFVTGVVSYANSVKQEASPIISTTKNALTIAKEMQTGIEQARASINSAKQYFQDVKEGYHEINGMVGLSDQSKTSNYDKWSNAGASSTYASSVTLKQETDKALAQVLIESVNPSHTPGVDIGTTSKLEPIVGSSAAIIPSTQALPNSDHALAVLLASVTWYRQLYSTLVEHYAASKLQAFCGTALDHLSVFEGSATDMQSEQLSNFESLVSRKTPDDPRKNLWVYRTYQKTLETLYSSTALLSQSSVIQSTLSYMGLALNAYPIRDLMREIDFAVLSTKHDEILTVVKSGLSVDPSERAQLATDYVQDFVTTAISCHRASDTAVTKRIEHNAQIAFFCLVWINRSVLLEYLRATTEESRELIKACAEDLYSIELDSLVFSHTDFNGLVVQDQPIYIKPNYSQCALLGYALLRHYKANQSQIKKSALGLQSDHEQTSFDAFAFRLDALLDSQMPQVLSVVNDTGSVSYLDASAHTQLQLGEQLTAAMIENNKVVLDAGVFPDHVFETYYADPNTLYLDEDVAFIRQSLI